jgi:ABC-type glycerol-3-phosphate transport system substrate-binding protein
VEVTTDIGPEPVTITVRANEDQKDLWDALAHGFEEAYPSVTVSLKTEAFATLQQNAPRYLAAANAPDLLRLAAPGDAVANGLLLNLDEYAEAYGWDEFPASQLEQWQFDESGRVRGSGSLFALGVGFGLVGVYYNKADMEALGQTAPPGTFAEFEQLLVAASDDGKIPLLSDVSFLVQGTALAHGAGDTISNWVFNSPDATIVAPEMIDAADTVQQWVEDGLLPVDAATADATTSFGRFSNGDAAFFYSGSWFSKALDAAEPGAYGFFLLPPAEVGDAYQTMSAPNATVIPAGAEHPNEAAAFLNWINSEDGQKAVAEVGGLAPGGSIETFSTADDEASVFSQTLSEFERLSADDGLVDFLANATAGMATSALTPQGQLLAGGRITPEQFVTALQDEYESSRSGG